MTIEIQAGSESPNRTLLSDYVYGMRWWVAAAMGMLTWIIVQNRLWDAWLLGPLVALTGLCYVVIHARRAQFDDHTLYFLRTGQEEEHVRFTDITAIKATGMKVNQTRIWRIEYKDRDGLARKYWFRPRNFLSWPYTSKNILYPTDFLNAVQAANPHVIIWWHPFFFHDQPWKG